MSYTTLYSANYSKYATGGNVYSSFYTADYGGTPVEVQGLSVEDILVESEVVGGPKSGAFVNAW